MASGDIFWSEGIQGEDGVSFVPGISDVKPSKQTRVMKSTHQPQKQNNRERKKRAKDKNAEFQISKSKQEKADDVVESKQKQSPKKQSHSAQQRASLKDLCPEDKQRVANLVRELSRANEAQESSEQELGRIKQSFDEKLSAISADKAQMEADRQQLMAQFQDCQKLLAFYQSQLIDQQKEVTHDITRLLSKAAQAVSPKLKSPNRFPLTSEGENETESGYSRERNYRDKDESLIATHPRNHKVPPAFDPQDENSDDFGLRQFADDFIRNVSHVGEVEPPAMHFKEPTTRWDASPSDRFNKSPRQPDTRPSGRIDTGQFGPHDTSPHGRHDTGHLCHRDKLVMQKRALEEEQSRLQLLLQEQEQVLRRRKSEIRRRNEEYSERAAKIRVENHTRSPRYDSTTSCPPFHSTVTAPQSANEFGSFSEARLDHSSDHVTESQPITSEILYASQGGLTQTTLDGSSQRSGHVTSELTQGSRPASQRSNSRWTTSTSYATPVSQMRNRPSSLLDSSRVTSQADDVSEQRHRMTSSLSRHDCTMNNLSDLSALVDTVERAADVSRDVMGLSVSGDDVMRRSTTFGDVTRTFDGEDSELLEDIFFIK